MDCLFPGNGSSKRRQNAARQNPAKHRAFAVRTCAVDWGVAPNTIPLVTSYVANLIGIPMQSYEIPAVVLAHGKNGFGATSELGIARVTPATWDNTLDEFNNANNSMTFWSRTRTDNPGAAGGQFDDIVVWITPSILFSRMVAAGRLP